MGRRKFAIVGHRAQSAGQLNLNDLAAAGGRIDVLVRAVNAALFLSHGIRRDTEVILHLLHGNRSGRRIKFDGSTLRGVHPDERAIAGQIGKVLLKERTVVGQWEEVHHGMSHSWGNLETTLDEWDSENCQVIHLTADADDLATTELLDWERPVGFVLSDDQPFTAEEEGILQLKRLTALSIGEKWLQGHIVIGIVHHIGDGRV